MSSYPYYIVDVFAEKKYAGNQLAVIRHAQPLSTDEMQRIANEMHFSETTFILSDKTKNGGYNVRIFTPEEELPFAGHPTLGTAHVVMNEIMAKPAKSVRLNLKVGPIPVEESNGVLWMRQNVPVFGTTVDKRKVAPAIGVRPEDVDDRFPVQVVSTGIPFVIVPLKANGCLRKARRDPARLG